MLCQLGSNGSCPTTVFALNGDNAEHGLFLVYRHSSAGLRFFDQENSRDHQQNGHSQEPEAIEVGKHSGLSLDGKLQERIGLLVRAGGTCAMGLHGSSSPG